ncbi:MAG: efflux RND transporter periplasmic adaptor subunit [Spirochaetales bacterium]|nr:efflux RND transporter periplasmic adaptor subunit [Spirochaetales bacterium]
MEAERKIIHVDTVGPRTSKKKQRRILILAAGFVLAVAAVFFIFLHSGKADSVSIKDYTVTTVRRGTLVTTTEAGGTVVLPRTLTITSGQEGYTEELLVSEGDRVTQDSVLAVLHVPDLEDQRDSLAIKLEQAELELENLIIDYAYGKKNLERSLSRLEDDITEAEEDAASLRELAELKSSRQTDYENALEKVETLREQHEDTVTSLEEMKAKEALALEKQRVSIRQLEVDLDNIIEDIEEARIKSPIPGEILSINENLEIPGSLIQVTEALFVVSDRSEVYIDFDVYEQYASLLTIGGTMTVTVGTNTMDAEIVKIGKIATLDSDGLSATVEVRARPLTNIELTPGASAVSSIVIGKNENTLLLPRGPYLTTGNREYVYKIDGTKAYKTPVTYGSIEGSEVEILDGLSAGDEVITSGYQNFLDYDMIDLK